MADPSSSRSLYIIDLFLITSVLLVDATARLMHGPPMHRFLRYWLHHRAEHDSWYPMIQAYDWLREPHSGTLYQTLFFTQHVKFQYPPTALLPLAALRALGHWPTDNALNAINWFLFALMVLSIVTFALILARRAAVVPSETWLPSATVATVMLLAAAAFYPGLFFLRARSSTDCDRSVICLGLPLLDL